MWDVEGVREVVELVGDAVVVVGRIREVRKIKVKVVEVVEINDTVEIVGGCFHWVARCTTSPCARVHCGGSDGG